MINKFNRAKRSNESSMKNIPCLDWRVDKLETVAIRSEPVMAPILLLSAIFRQRCGRTRIQSKTSATFRVT